MPGDTPTNVTLAPTLCVYARYPATRADGDTTHNTTPTHITSTPINGDTTNTHPLTTTTTMPLLGDTTNTHPLTTTTTMPLLGGTTNTNTTPSPSLRVALVTRVTRA